MAIGESFRSVIESIKVFWQSFDIHKWAEGVGGSSADAVVAAAYFFLSFGAGFVFKKYFKFIFICLMFTIFFTKAMEYKEFLIIDWDAVESWLGWSSGQPMSLGTISDLFFDWIKDHLLTAIASVVGFLIGYKLG